MRVLFVAHASAGHTNTLASMALALKARGHEVRLMVPTLGLPSLPGAPELARAAAAIPATLRAMGVPVETVRLTLTSAYRGFQLAKKTGYDELRAAAGLFNASLEHYTRAVIRSLRATPTDVVVSDFAFAAAMLGADACGVPYATVYHAGLPFRGPGIPPMGSGLPIGGPRDEALDRYEALERELTATLRTEVNETRAKFRLAPVDGDLRTPISPWLNLVVSHPCIEAPREALGPHTAFVGPCFQTRSGRAEHTFPWRSLDERAVRVYVSLGTVFNERPEVFRRILQGLARAPFQVVVSAGGSYDTLLRDPLPANVLLFRRVPQVDLLPKMHVVVGHGGNNSTNETLYFGRPLVVLPIGGEQHDNARRVEWLGVGRMLSIERFTATELGDAVSSLHDAPAVRTKLDAIASTLAQTDGAQVSAALIEQLGRTRAPIALRDGGVVLPRDVGIA